MSSKIDRGSICVFADSIAWGADDSDKLGWATRLALWDKDQPQRRLVYNLGVAGDTTADILKRLDSEAMARDPEIIMFAVGVNDSAQNGSQEPRVSPKQFEENLKELITKARTIVGENIIMVGLTPADESKTTPVFWNTDAYYYEAAIEKYDKILQRVAKQEEIHYIPMYSTLTLSDLKDGLHPDEHGHEIMYQKIRQFLVDKGYF